MTNKDYFEKIAECLKFGEQTKQSEYKRLLTDIYTNRHLIVRTEENSLSGLTKCLIQALKLEIPADEAEEIDSALIAYYSCSKEIENVKDNDCIIAASASRVILLFLYGELLLDSLMSIIYTKERYPEDALLHQRRLCEDMINKMILTDIYNMDEIDEEREQDAVIEEICHITESKTEIDNKSYENAELMHKVLFHYIKKAMDL